MKKLTVEEIKVIGKFVGANKEFITENTMDLMIFMESAKDHYLKLYEVSKCVEKLAKGKNIKIEDLGVGLGLSVPRYSVETPKCDCTKGSDSIDILDILDSLFGKM